MNYIACARQMICWLMVCLALIAGLALAAPFGASSRQAADTSRIFLILTDNARAADVLHTLNARVIDQPHRFGVYQSYLIATTHNSGPADLYAAGALAVLTGRPKNCGPTTASLPV